MTNQHTSPLILALVEHPRTNMDLYPHQAVMLDDWDEHDSFMVVSKTGTGKTASAMLPILKNRLNAIAVYPTNELVKDQVTSVKDLAEREGIVACEWTPDAQTAEFSKSDVVLIHLDSQKLRDWRKDRPQFRTNGDAIQYLLVMVGKPCIVFTNPDIVFLIFALRYKPEALASLQQYGTLVLDEFHLYTGVELAHALMMVHLGRCLGTFEKIVLLTATPEPKVKDLLDRLLRPLKLVDTDVETERRKIDERMAVNRVDLSPVHANRRDIVETALHQLLAREAEIRQKRKENQHTAYIPAVIVVSSVVNAIALEDSLVEEGFDRSELAIIRGLTSREVRSTENKLIAIGTSAIEVGVDFRCDWLIFEATEAASFMQRFGRVGRHLPGTAVILCPSNVITGFESQPIEMSRSTLEGNIYNWYAQRDAHSWFVASSGGLITTRALIESILKRTREDFFSEQEQIDLISDAFTSFWEGFAETIGCERKLIEQTQRKFRNALAGKRHLWIKDYVKLNSFRTSLPNEWVHDFAEGERRKDRKRAKYQADIKTLLHRAEGLRFNEKIWNPFKGDGGGYGILTVKGYDHYKRVHVIPEFDEYENGELLSTAEHEDVAFIQEGHKTSVSHVMALRSHVFTLVPKELRSHLDWRLPIFDCGSRLIAFDGTALLVKEIFARSRSSCRNI